SFRPGLHLRQANDRSAARDHGADRAREVRQFRVRLILFQGFRFSLAGRRGEVYCLLLQLQRVAWRYDHSFGFVALLRETLAADTRFPGLTLDVTDAHQIKNSPGLWEVIAQLKLHRVALALTDIGAAYAAAGRNQAFPFTEIKIDADIVTNCLLHKTKFAVCQSLVDLAHSVGATACAEGVANIDQIPALIAMGCDSAQGPFFGKPQPLDSFKAALRAAGAETNPVQGGGDPYEWPDDTAAA